MQGDGFVLPRVIGGGDIAAREELAAAGFNLLQQTANPLLAERGCGVRLVGSAASPAGGLRLLHAAEEWPMHADVPEAVATATGRV